MLRFEEAARWPSETSKAANCARKAPVFAYLLAMTFIAAAPTATQAPAPILREVGQQHAVAGVCGPLVVHANAAIEAAQQGDQFLSRTIVRLRSLDLETSLASRRSGLTDLNRLATALSESSLRGESELR